MTEPASHEYLIDHGTVEVTPTQFRGQVRCALCNWQVETIGPYEMMNQKLSDRLKIHQERRHPDRVLGGNAS